MKPVIQAVLLALAILAGLVVAGSFSIQVSEPGWSFQVLDNDTVGFTEVEVGDRVHVVARTEQGLKHFSKPRTLLSLSSESQWESRFIAEGSSTGSYASLELISGTPMVGFQYADVGGERVRLGVWNGTAWRVDTVPGESGLNVGMGTELASLRGSPVLFYTGNGEESLRAAERRGSNWTKRVLEPNVGVFTEAEKCGSSVRAVYASRDQYNVSIGRLSEDSWESRGINTTATSLALATDRDCQAFIGAHSGSDNEVFVWNGSKRRIDTSILSRISADFDSGIPYTLYGKSDSGVHIGNGGNKHSIIYRAPGDYNDLEVKDGNRYATFTNESELVYAEYNTQLPERRQEALLAVRAVLSLIALLALLAVLLMSSRFREQLDDLVSKK
jgi:hypothetical protein